jgi:hypothetical protein
MHFQRPCSFTGSRVPPSWAAFTRLDLLAILVLVAVLSSVVLPALAGVRPRSLVVECANNLRRVGRGFQAWASDHGDRYPWSVPRAEGGSFALTDVAEHFRAASNELGSPLILVCPSDTNRVVVSQWVYFFSSQSLSYFTGLHGNLSQPRAWLSGDRNVTGADGQVCSLTQVSNCTGFSQGSASTWLPNLHANAGNLLLGDGSVRQASQRDLAQLVGQAAAQDPEQRFHILRP